MSLDNVTPGDQAPEIFNVIIEIPMNADPVKYEVDKATGAIFVDRFMSVYFNFERIRSHVIVNDGFDSLIHRGRKQPGQQL